MASPDVAVYNREAWTRVEKSDIIFSVFAPDFLIEACSPQTRPSWIREKMDIYIANGVQIAWLVEPIDRRVTIFRPGREPRDSQQSHER